MDLNCSKKLCSLISEYLRIIANNKIIKKTTFLNDSFKTLKKISPINIMAAVINITL